MSKLTVDFLTHMFNGAYTFLSENFTRIHAMVDVTDMDVPVPLRPFIKNNTVRVSIGPDACPLLHVASGLMSAPMSIGGVKFVFQTELNRIAFLSDDLNDFVIPMGWSAIVNPKLLDDQDKVSVTEEPVNAEQSRILSNKENVVSVRFGK